MNLKLITFDVTNTILRFSKPPPFYYTKVAGIYGVLLNEKKVYSSFRETFKKHSLIQPNFGIENKGWVSWWTEVIKDTINSCYKGKIEESTLNIISHHLIKLYSTSEPYIIVPEFFPLFNYLSSLNLCIGAISNTDERLPNILTQLGIFHYFNFVLTSYRAKVLKPNPEIFKFALNLAPSEISPEEALHIGDSLIEDYIGSKEAQWNSILVSSNYEDQCKLSSIDIDNKFMVHSLECVHEILKRY